MRSDKKYIFNLRRSGKSFREIQVETGVSRATLTAWFKDIPWSLHFKKVNTARHLEGSKERLLKMNTARKQQLDSLYSNAKEEAKKEYQLYKKNPLFWAGLMIYAGEGDKKTRHLIRISNSEFYLHKIFIVFSEKYLGVSKGSIRVAIVLYPDHNQSLCKEMWANMLNIPREHFHKTQVIKGKEPVKRLQYGVGISIIFSTLLKKKLMEWLFLAQDERFENAAMV